MEYRLLGRSGLKVSALAMGTMTLGRNKSGPTGSVGLRDAKRLIDQCLAAGVNLIDTANVYAKGQSEEIVGAALKGKRDKVVLATKARFNMLGLPNTGGNSRINLIAECERSLKRLQTDWIDLYQVHQWDGETPVEETMEALDSLVKAGKVRYVGCSNFSGWHVMKALAAAKEGGLPALRQPADPLHAAGARGGIRAGADLARPGARHPCLEPDRGRTALGKIPPRQRGPGRLPPFRAAIGGSRRSTTRRSSSTSSTCSWTSRKAHRCSAARVALAWLLARPGVTSVIIGGRTEEQFADNLASADLKLSAEEMARLEAVSRPPLLYPYWHQAWTAKDRLSAPDLALLQPFLG